MQIKNVEDIAMLVIPKAFRTVMKHWLVMKPPQFIRLCANKWCELWVQVQIFQGEMVLASGWNYCCNKHEMVPGGLLILK